MLSRTEKKEQGKGGQNIDPVAEGVHQLERKKLNATKKREVCVEKKSNHLKSNLHEKRMIHLEERSTS